MEARNGTYQVSDVEPLRGNLIFEDVSTMTTMRPPSGTPSYPEKTTNPIFPPMSHSNGNGMTPTGNAPTTPIQYPPQTHPPIFPPTLPQNNSLASTTMKVNPLLPTPSTMNNQFPNLPPTMNSGARATPPIQPPHMLSNNASATPPPVPMSNAFPNVPSTINTTARATPPPSSLSNHPFSNAPPTMNTAARATPPAVNNNAHSTPPPSMMNNQFPNHPPTMNSGARATPPIQPPHMLNSNASATPPPPPMNNPLINAPPMMNPAPLGINANQQAPMHNTNTYATPPGPPPSSSQGPSMLNSNGTVPPPMPTTFNSAPARPMYPSPAALYQVPPSTAPRPSYPTPTPNPSYNQNSMPPAPPSGMPGHPGQPMPYPNSAMPQQPNNNVNYPTYNNDMVDLLKEKTLVSAFAEEPPVSPLLSEENQQMNCSPEVMRCSLNVIPQTKDLLNKSRLPLGILIHPFKDLESLSVIQGTKIVRCDACKSYINPFVTFLDNTRWRCSICSRVNDLPQEFLFDPITKTYGDPSRRPEVRFGTVEYTATADYMARPPQPAMYLFLLDVSHNAVQTGYLQSFCDILLESLNTLPGDARTQIGFLTYDSRLHFYDLSDRHNGSFRVMIMPDLDEKLEDSLPLPDGLMVTLAECRAVVENFLQELPKLYQDNHETDSALGAALQIAQKLLSPTGGRVTVVQTRIPNVNPGALIAPVNASGSAASKEPTIIAPTSDYYKKLALDYASFQIACDLFLLNTHHVDIATLSCIAKYSAGEVKYYPGFHSVQTPHEVERFENDLRRYLQRKIGFEAVMRLRCPPAFSIHTFHGNGFVRSVDLLVLPNINPDAAFGIQVAIEDSLAHQKSATFQVALLYTSSKGERRIRVHTLALPISSNLNEIFANADQEAVVSLVAKMAADRSMTSSISEAREAMTNVACDVLRACLANNSTNRVYSFMVPYSLRLLPLYMLSMIKSTAFRPGSLYKVDDRAYYLDLCKTLPIPYLMQIFYPDLYPIHTIEDKSQVVQDGEDELHIPPRTHLSYAHIDSHGAYILDTSEYIYIYIGKAISDHFVQSVFNVPTFSSLPYDAYSLPEFENSLSTKIHNFLSYLIQSRPHGVGIHIMREDSPHRHLFTRHLVDDKSESTMSYEEFFRYVREQINK